jgi:hypothetical protein
MMPDVSRVPEDDEPYDEYDRELSERGLWYAAD